VAIESKIELLASSENTIGLSFEFPGEQSSKVAKTLVLVEFYPGPTNGINQLEIKQFIHILMMKILSLQRFLNL